MKIGFVTDSPSDLPADLAERHGIIIIPAVLVMEGRDYIDGQDITREQFYERLPALKTPPTTAAPSPASFHQAYQTLFSRGCDQVISLHTSERLTAIANIARQVASEFDGRITVLDSASLTLGVGFQVLAGMEAAEEGLPLPDVLAAIESTRKRVRVAAALDTMDYLRRSGRVPAAVTAIGGLLSIKPVVEIHKGQIKFIQAARTTQQATNALQDFLQVLGPLERLTLLHTNAEHRARNLLTTLMSSPVRLTLPREIGITNVTSVIGTHVGPGGLGFAAVTAA